MTGVTTAADAPEAIADTGTGRVGAAAARRGARGTATAAARGAAEREPTARGTATRADRPDRGAGAFAAIPESAEAPGASPSAAATPAA